MPRLDLSDTLELWFRDDGATEVESLLELAGQKEALNLDDGVVDGGHTFSQDQIQVGDCGLIVLFLEGAAHHAILVGHIVKFRLVY